MADSNFVVKNGLTVNGSFTANATAVNAAAITATTITVGTVTINSSTINVGSIGINSTGYSGSASTANNASFLGGTAAASYALLAGPTFTGTVTTGNTLTIGTAAYHVANGNLGIGTASPAAKLEVNGAATVGGLLTGGSLVVSANAANVGTAVYVVSNGNLGVGLSSPTSKLHVSGSTNITGDLTIGGTYTMENNDSMRFAANNGTTYSLFIHQSDNSFVFYNTNTSGGQRAIWSSVANSDNGTFTLGSGVGLRLNGSTSGYVGLQAAAAAGSTTYTLPSADGTSGQSLVTNGSGTLSWSSVGGQLRRQVFAADGSWTAPAGVTRAIVTCVGASGGNAGQGPCCSNRGNAGAGGFIQAEVTVSPGVSYTVTVGVGGTGATGAGNGTAGGTTSFGSLASATGGARGTYGGADGANGSGTTTGTALRNNTTAINGTIFSGDSYYSGSTTPVAWSVTSSYGAGYRSVNSGGNSGGVGGAVMVEWVG